MIIISIWTGEGRVRISQIEMFISGCRWGCLCSALRPSVSSSRLRWSAIVFSCTPAPPPPPKRYSRPTNCPICKLMPLDWFGARASLSRSCSHRASSIGNCQFSICLSVSAPNALPRINDDREYSEEDASLQMNCSDFAQRLLFPSLPRCECDCEAVSGVLCLLLSDLLIVTELCRLIAGHRQFNARNDHRHLSSWHRIKLI